MENGAVKFSGSYKNDSDTNATRQFDSAMCSTSRVLRICLVSLIKRLKARGYRRKTPFVWYPVRNQPCYQAQLFCMCCTPVIFNLFLLVPTDIFSIQFCTPRVVGA
jgi:hypothetical protein